MDKRLSDYKVGEEFQGFLLVKSVVKREARNGSSYLNVTLSDSSGDITAMIWDADQDKEALFKQENILKVKGNITEYQGNLQLSISQSPLNARLSVDEDGVNLEDLLRSAPEESSKLLQELADTVGGMESKVFKSITLNILQRVKSELREFPAARSNHHDYVGGLLYHTVSMLRIAKSITELYPILNKDLLYAGIILHDIGKVWEYTGAVSTDFTFKGRLLGHISMINADIQRAADELGHKGEEVTLLQHMVLSHHGKLEYGSPVLPALPEAYVLHQIDAIDAGLDALKTEFGVTEENSFTGKIFSLGNRQFYKHNLE